MKSTSATGFLRGATEPDARLQDLRTLPMLCDDCEQIFSKSESYFASKIFYPFMDGERNIVYDDTLMRFIISLSWRTLKIGYYAQVSAMPWVKEHVDKAEQVWRRFLLNESLETGPCEHYMFFLDYVDNGSGLPSGFQAYTLRATDSTLASNDNDIVFSYTHIPWVFFVSTIFPFQLSGWYALKIDKTGKTALTFELGDGKFGNFLIDRSKIVSSALEKIDATKDNKILGSIKKNPERFLTSESFKLMLEESRRERREKAKDLLECIAELINIIDRSLGDPELNSLQQKWVAYAQNLIAKELANLPSDKATLINTRIETAMRAAAITKIGIECAFETDLIDGKLIICFFETKEEQMELLRKSLEGMIKGRKPNDKRFVVIFTFNPLDPVLPYETGYYFGNKPTNNQ